MLEFVGTAFPLSQGGVNETLTSSGLGIAELWAVLSVETSGCGYLPDRRPKILFERHVFSRLTEHRYDAGDADISQPTAVRALARTLGLSVGAVSKYLRAVRGCGIGATASAPRSAGPLRLFRGPAKLRVN